MTTHGTNIVSVVADVVIHPAFDTQIMKLFFATGGSGGIVITDYVTSLVNGV